MDEVTETLEEKIRHRHWPDSDVAQHFFVYPDPEWSIPYGTHIFVFNDQAALKRACEEPEDEDLAARSYDYRAVDAEGCRGLIMFTKDHLPVSVVSHEVTHLILMWAASEVSPHRRAKKWLADHPEWVAEAIGNMTGLIWNALRDRDEQRWEVGSNGNFAS